MLGDVPGADEIIFARTAINELGHGDRPSLRVERAHARSNARQSAWANVAGKPHWKRS